MSFEKLLSELVNCMWMARNVVPRVFVFFLSVGSRPVVPKEREFYV